MIEGPGGILRNVHPTDRPIYNAGKRRLSWNNGSWATIFSDEVPDQLRGFSGDTAWLDEFAKFKNPIEVWDMLQFGMRERSGDKPRQLITTTPRPLKILLDIAKQPDTVVVEGTSYENKANLDESFFKGLEKYEGTRIGRQEILGEILEDVSGALWNREQIDKLRVKSSPTMRRVVVAIDPAATSGEESDETGLIVAGLGQDGHGYVLDDVSGRYSPTEWADKAVKMYRKWDADRVIGETNNGGEMIETVLRVADRTMPYRAVHASRGKVTRAEPVSALYERGMIHHVGSFPELEDQQCAFTIDFDRKAAGYSPDRVDALCWACHELMLEQMVGYGAFEYMRREAEKVTSGANGKLDITMPPPPTFGFSIDRRATSDITKVRLKSPKGAASVVFGASGNRYVSKGGMIEVMLDDVKAFEAGGFRRAEL